jgi:hypothetical protein
VRIDVEDNGTGIDESIMHKIYEPYFTTKEEGKGTGIGLYMSKVIIENSMHGQLTVKNIAGGACFQVSLPDGAAPPRTSVRPGNKPYRCWHTPGDVIGDHTQGPCTADGRQPRQSGTGQGRSEFSRHRSRSGFQQPANP